MSIASDALREEAARFRRLKFLIADEQALRAIDDFARELEQKADAIEAGETDVDLARQASDGSRSPS